MKKNLFLILILCLAMVLMAGCGEKDPDPADTNDTTATTDNPVIKIGVFQPASGDNGAGGKQETLGTQYANSVCPTVEIDGVTYDVKLVAVDNESSTEKAATAASTLISEGCSVVLGSYGSAVSIAASDIFGQAGIPVIGVSCTNPQVTEGNDHYFRICFIDPFQGTVLASYAAKTLEGKTAYCLAKLGDDYSVGLCNYFIKAFEDLGGTVIYNTFPEGNTDFNSYITNAINGGADVFVSPVSTEAAALIIEQAAAQNMSIPILAGDTWDSNVILEAAKGKNLTIDVTTFFTEGSTDETTVKFLEDIKAWINADATNLTNNNGNDIISAGTVMGYDAYFVALEAIKAANSADPAAIKAALPSVTYTGISGAISFNETGDANRDVAYIKTVNTETGAWDFVTVQSI